MHGPSDASGIPVIAGALLIGTGALTLIISLFAWLSSATEPEGTMVNVPTRGRPADGTGQSPAPRKRTVWGTIRQIINWWWRM